MRTCTIEGCDKKHRSRGLCSTHYNQAHQPNRHHRAAYRCGHCGVEVVKFKDARFEARFCSTKCRDDWRRETGTNPHPPTVDTLWLGAPKAQCLMTLRAIAVAQSAARKSAAARPGTRARSPRFVGCVCVWCDTHFTHDRAVTGTISKFCTDRCSRRYHKHARRIRQGRFDIHRRDRLAIYERDSWTCQLCMESVDPALPPTHPWAATLDHIVCQSWTLIPDHSPSNLRLAHRMCNSIRGDERRAA